MSISDGELDNRILNDGANTERYLEDKPDCHNMATNRVVSDNKVANNTESTDVDISRAVNGDDFFKTDVNPSNNEG